MKIRARLRNLISLHRKETKHDAARRSVLNGKSGFMWDGMFAVLSGQRNGGWYE